MSAARYRASSLTIALLSKSTMPAPFAVESPVYPMHVPGERAGPPRARLWRAVRPLTESSCHAAGRVGEYGMMGKGYQEDESIIMTGRCARVDCR